MTYRSDTLVEQGGVKMAAGTKQQLKLNRMKSRRGRGSASSSKTPSAAGKSATIKPPTAGVHVTLPRPVVLPDLMNEAVYRKYLKEAEAEVRETRKQRAAGVLYRVFQQLLH
jgi:hypothetical protein